MTAAPPEEVSQHVKLTLRDDRDFPGGSFIQPDTENCHKSDESVEQNPMSRTGFCVMVQPNR